MPLAVYTVPFGSLYGATGILYKGLNDRRNKGWAKGAKELGNKGAKEQRIEEKNEHWNKGTLEQRNIGTQE